MYGTNFSHQQIIGLAEEYEVMANVKDRSFVGSPNIDHTSAAVFMTLRSALKINGEIHVFVLR
jgi:hypothetical protein